MLANIADLVVVELGNSVAAPFAGQIFADFGAKVVKIEKGAAPKANNTQPIIYEERDFFRNQNSKKNSVPIFATLLQRFRAGQDWKGNPR